MKDIGDAKLVLVEWHDSAQPIPRWQFLGDAELPGVVNCLSVGWLIDDCDNHKVVAPNLGNIGCADSVQFCGAIQIPVGCIVKITPLPALDVTEKE